MKKEKSKVNFLRFGILFCAFFIFFLVPVFAAGSDTLYYVLIDEVLIPPSEVSSYDGTFYFGGVVSESLLVTPRAFIIEDLVLNGIYYFDSSIGFVQIYDWDNGLIQESYGCFAFSGLTLSEGTSAFYLFNGASNFGFNRTFKSELSFTTGTFRFGSFSYDKSSPDVSYTSISVPFVGSMRYEADSDWVSAFYGTWHVSRNIFSFNGIAPFDMASYHFLVANLEPVPTFLDRLTSGFTAAIGWLGDFFTSLFTSNLALSFVLVSVGFGLVLLSFGWRWIRRFLSGY